jgi:tetratricopeptide (TPR) repeat protein
VASRTDTLSPKDIRNALANRSRLLATGDPRVPERQRSLTRLLDWSYDLLSTAEQAALRRLTVFSASFDLATAATAISDDEEQPERIAELVWLLAAKSLVSVEPAAGTSRYRLLRTVRSYAATHLEGSERVDASRRLTERFTQAIGPGVIVDRDWVGDMALELHNLRSLVFFPGIDEQLRQKLAWSIGRFHDLTDDFATGVQEVERHLEALPGESPERVALLTMLADMRLRVGDLIGATRAIDAAASLREQVGAPSWDDAGVQRTRGDLAMRAGRYDDARRIIEDALDGDLSLRGRARLLGALGLTHAAKDDYDASDLAFRGELELWSELRDDSLVATTLGNLAETALRRDRLDEAARHQLACLEVARSLGQPVLVAFSIIMAAHISARRKQWHEAIGLQLAADAVLADVGYVLFDTDERSRRELLDAARQHLGLDADRGAGFQDPGPPLEDAIETAARMLESVT